MKRLFVLLSGLLSMLLVSSASADLNASGGAQTSAANTWAALQSFSANLSLTNNSPQITATCPTGCVTNINPFVIQAGTAAGSFTTQLTIRTFGNAANQIDEFRFGNNDIFQNCSAGWNGDCSLLLNAQGTGTNVSSHISIGDATTGFGTWECTGANFAGVSAWYAGGPLTGSQCDIGGGGATVPLAFYAGGIYAGYIAAADRGLIWGAPTGASKGTGTINAVGVYSGGTQLLPALSGTSVSLGGGALAAGACASGTVTITGATTAMAVQATPVTYPGNGAYWLANITAANTVTVYVCAAVALTPVASTYNVRVIQ